MGNARENKWFIAYKKNPGWLELKDFTIIEPEKGTYEADPFIIKHKDKTYIFFELYDYNKGVIAIRELTEDGPTKPEIVLEKPYHLSFPSVIEINGEFYMTPEEVNSGALRIYKARNFPYDWEEVAEVEKGWFADAIMYQKDGYFFICATEGDNLLRIFRSENLLGPWDKDTAGGVDMRNAGHIFPYGGEMIRPVQECHQRYGRAILFQRMSDLKTIKTIEPDWLPNLTGTHTLNFNDDYIVIDARTPYDS